MTEQTTTTEAPTDAREDLEKILQNIPAGRWLVIRRALQMSTDEILTDTVASVVVAANEKGRAENGGQDDWDRLLAMPVRQLSKLLGISDDEDGDASKSERSPVVEVPAGAVGDPGVGAGVVGEPGPVVPADEPVTS